MSSSTVQTPFADASAMAALHACRSQEELEVEFAAGLEQLLPDRDVALCLADAVPGELQVRFAFGPNCPVRPHTIVHRDAWPADGGLRLPVRFRNQVLGELFVRPAPSPEALTAVTDALAHYGVALVNHVLHKEARQATDDYCASLQALEEGIVLFQEADSAAVTARLLALASGMVQATAGALFVLDNVGDPESELRLEQTLGMPEHLLAGFRTADGGAWPRPLLDWPVQVVGRDSDGSIACVAKELVPAVLQQVVVLPLRYHGVVAGICVLFNPLLDTEGRDHVGRLQSFGQLAAALLHRLSLEALKEHAVTIERELQIAESIQRRLVPQAAPSIDGYEFAWRSLAAKSIGGDYLDFLRSDLGDLCAVVADASGHGINSALLMTSFRATYRGSAPWQDPHELAALLNGHVTHEVGPTGMFITAALVYLDLARRRLAITSAGHNPCYLLRGATGRVETIESHGPPLGFVAGAHYAQFETALEPTDVLLLYTDGITEATAPDGQMFGEPRLLQLLREHAAAGAEVVLERVLAALRAFTGRERQDDDVSLLVLRATGDRAST